MPNPNVVGIDMPGDSAKKSSWRVSFQFRQTAVHLKHLIRIDVIMTMCGHLATRSKLRTSIRTFQQKEHQTRTWWWTGHSEHADHLGGGYKSRISLRFRGMNVVCEIGCAGRTYCAQIDHGRRRSLGLLLPPLLNAPTPTQSLHPLNLVLSLFLSSYQRNVFRRFIHYTIGIYA